MLQAMLAGVTSIKAQQERMNEIGNNLANINTTAYKSSDVQFADLLSVSISSGKGPGSKTGGVNPEQLGLGVQVSSIDINSEQGSLSATNRPTDLAIQGNGFFAVSDGTTMSYTRDGSFGLDSNGDLVMRANGKKVVGYSADATGKINTGIAPTAASSINIPLGGLSSSKGTTTMSISGNLDGKMASTDSWSSQIRVYDQQGGPHDLTIVFKNRTSPAAGTPPTGAASSWDWAAYEGPATGTPISSSTGTGNTPIYFDGAGAYVSGLAAGTFNTVTVPASPGAPAETINVDFSGLTQAKATSTAAGAKQDGIPFGSLTNFTINQDGSIVGTFSNGMTRTLAQVAMASFQNEAGLSRGGDNLWNTSSNSGVANFGVANTGGRGSISAGYLEQSNVDITSQLTNLIITQRGYQANTKIVSTVDEMMQDVLNLKR